MIILIKNQRKMTGAGPSKFLNGFKLSNLAYKEIKPLWADQRDFDRPKFIYSWRFNPDEWYYYSIIKERLRKVKCVTG